MTPINLKKFIQAIHSAILLSNEQIINKNLALFDRYFEEKEIESIEIDGQTIRKKTLVPKTVLLSYPKRNEHAKENEDAFKLSMEPIEVPLISMVPLDLCGIKQATFSTEFQMEIINDELQIYFGKPASSLIKKNGETNTGKLEIKLSPQETTEGLKLMIEGYENYLKRQIT